MGTGVDFETGWTCYSASAQCHDQKSAGGTFDMFDAKLGNCVYYLGTTPSKLDGFAEADAPENSCVGGGGVGGLVSFGKVEPRGMVRLSECAGGRANEASRRLR